MSTKPQIELFLENESGTQQVAYPFVESDHVSLSNGMDIDTMIRQDVSMPTVAHEDLSFKVGVGDQDVSSAIVDSSVAEMTIKGKTYQNILPEPSTHVLTNNKEMFKVNEGLDPNVEIVDGVSKSAILSGSTKYQIGEFIQDVYAHVQQFKTGYYLGFSDGTLIKGENNHKYCEDYIPLPTGVTSITSKGSSYWKKLCCYDSNKNFISGVNGTAGLEDLTLNIPSNAKYFRYSTNTDQGENEYINVVSNTGLLLASSNYNIPCELISCKMPVLCTTGKNLLNLSSLSNSCSIRDGGYYIDVTLIKGGGNYNLFSETTGLNTVQKDVSNFIKLKPNTTYTLSIAGETSATVSGSVFDLDGNRIIGTSALTSNVSSRIFTTTEDAIYFAPILATAYSNETTTIVGLQLEEGSTRTTYEPFKSNILSTPEEVVLRSLPNGVCDTLNLVTGELVQRIGEKMLKGASNEGWIANHKGASYQFVLPIEDATSVLKDNKVATLNSDTIPSVPNHTILSEELNVEKWGIAQRNNGNKGVFIAIPASAIETYTVESFKQWLAQNPITVQYELATPIVKTVDLSTSGNWEKVVLDGSENWTTGNDNLSSVYRNYVFLPNSIHGTNLPCFANDSNFPNIVYGENKQGVVYGAGNSAFYVFSDKKKYPTLESFKKYLSQNPLTVWYQTATHQDSTQVKQPIFFKDGHIVQSSGADSSLIPTLDYQAKTSNSYVMDLMKTNTKYTMKAKSANGTFTIDGTSYGAGTNGTFTTPSSMTNKFLVMSNKTNEEVMILEGDVTNKTIPYFKGIKSAFENEDKIEVLSCGKNLYTGTNMTAWQRNEITTIVEPNKTYTISADVETEVEGRLRVDIKVGNDSIKYYTTPHVLGTTKRVSTTFTVPSDAKEVFIVAQNFDSVSAVNCSNIQIEEALASTSYEPCKSNSTKIPLLSPLRSLPNGTCDELIIDRMKKKATLIQRVYEIVLNDKHLGTGNNPDGNLTFMGRWYFDRLGIPRTVYNGTGGINANKMPIIPYGNNIWVGDSEGITIQDYQNQIIDIRVSKSKLSQPNHNGLLKWANDNPIIFQYELETPIITEVDLEGFPYIYKDGHIFLNGDIAPVTEIKYSINQQHQIEASNQDIIRHQKEIDYLYKLIGEYVRVDYKNTLLSLNLELK